MLTRAVLHIILRSCRPLHRFVRVYLRFRVGFSAYHIPHPDLLAIVLHV